MSEYEIEKSFPNLQRSGYSITSPATIDYNCIAWVADDTEIWWWPDPQYGYYWPSGILRTETIETFIEAFKLLGYTKCEDHKYENGFEKIAIFADSNGKPTHAARQLSSGKWTSKLGRAEDIEHHSLEGIEGSDYGSVTIILKRPEKNKS